MLHHIGREIAKNALMGVPAIRRWRSRRGRTTTDNQVRQMRDQFAFFIGTLGDVRGKTIAEIGPGDAISLGAMFLKAGAARYIAFDRFRGPVFGPAAMNLYKALGCDDFDSSRVSLNGSIEAGTTERADIVISFDVLEHVRDPHLALRNMAAMQPSAMVHRIDYSAHDIWRSYDEELFLKFPGWVWAAMGSNRGYPNRERHADIVTTLNTLGMPLDIRVPRRFRNGDALLAEIACGTKLGPQFPY